MLMFLVLLFSSALYATKYSTEIALKLYFYRVNQSFIKQKTESQLKLKNKDFLSGKKLL